MVIQGGRAPHPALIAALWFAGALAAPASEDSRPLAKETLAQLEQWAPESNFVFEGAVTRPAAAPESLAGTLPLERTALVRVEKVLLAPELLADQEGKELALVVAAPWKLKELGPATKATFFARIALVGRDLAADEVGRLTGPERLQLRESLPRLVEETWLKERLRGADLTVTAAVLAVRPFVSKELPEGRSEHEPAWMEAVLRVQSVLGSSSAVKAPGPGGTVTMLFPSSIDVAWASWPKPVQDQEGLFILRLGSGAGDEKGPRVLVARDPLDLQPPESRRRVAELLRTLAGQGAHR